MKIQKPDEALTSKTTKGEIIVPPTCKVCRRTLYYGEKVLCYLPTTKGYPAIILCQACADNQLLASEEIAIKPVVFISNKRYYLIAEEKVEQAKSQKR